MKKLLALPLDRLRELAAEEVEQPPQQQNDADVQTSASEEKPAGEPSIEDHAPQPTEPAQPKASKRASTKRSPRTDLKEQHPGPTPAPLASEVKLKSPVPADLTDAEAMRDEFYGDLAVYKEVNELDFQMKPRIRGRIVDLYALAMLVDDQDTSLEEADWTEIAKSLEYSKKDVTAAADTLRQFYHDNLVDFLDAIADFPGDGRKEEEEELEEDQRPVVTATRKGLESPKSYVPTSPLMSISGIKRSLDAEEEQPAVTPSGKRRRVSHGAEIPSTPDEKVGPERRGPDSELSSSRIHRINELLQQEHDEHSRGTRTLSETVPLQASGRRPEMSRLEKELGKDHQRSFHRSKARLMSRLHNN